MYWDQSGELLDVSNDGLLAYLAPSLQHSIQDAFATVKKNTVL